MAVRLISVCKERNREEFKTMTERRLTVLHKSLSHQFPEAGKSRQWKDHLIFAQFLTPFTQATALLAVRMVGYPVSDNSKDIHKHLYLVDLCSMSLQLLLYSDKGQFTKLLFAIPAGGTNQRNKGLSAKFEDGLAVVFCSLEYVFTFPQSIGSSAFSNQEVELAGLQRHCSICSSIKL